MLLELVPILPVPLASVKRFWLPENDRAPSPVLFVMLPEPLAVRMTIALCELASSVVTVTVF